MTSAARTYSSEEKNQLRDRETSIYRRAKASRKAIYIEDALMQVEIQKANDLGGADVFVGGEEPTARQGDQHIPESEGQQEGELYRRRVDASRDSESE